MSECGHDGWVEGCAICEREHALAMEHIGERSAEPHTCPECATVTWADERATVVRCRYCDHTFEVSTR